jgi:hypothetical protein
MKNLKLPFARFSCLKIFKMIGIKMTALLILTHCCDLGGFFNHHNKIIFDELV